MKFSIIMASYLGAYPTAASNREGKILRSINSIIGQTFDDWELIIVADGCTKTIEICSSLVSDKIKCFLIPKAKQWSGEPRMEGISQASGDYILYLDIDDILGADHLKNINSQLNSYDWVWFNDVRYSIRLKEWYENECNIDKISMHGTSNICHKRVLPVKWDYTGYAHDYYFILQLKQNKNFAKIEGSEYYVCHIPGGPQGYDL
jgi:glycosyltransferase involved in cell wall biosynthesis